MNTWINDVTDRAICVMDKDMQARLWYRRMIRPESNMKLVTIQTSGNVSDRRGRLLLWIDRYTSGNFYLGGSQIGFRDERDTITFMIGFEHD